MLQLEIVFPVKPTIMDIIEKREKKLRAHESRPKKHRKQITSGAKKTVRERDNERCTFCGNPLTPHHHNPRQRLTIDHIKPWSWGGTNAMENLVLSCFDCNQLKGDVLFPDLLSAQETIATLQGVNSNYVYS